MSKNKNNNLWQAPAIFNQSVNNYRNEILSLAINRYRWTGLPETCDAAYLEKVLACEGIATIAKTPDLDMWVSTRCVQGKLGLYDEPTKWRSVSYDEKMMSFECTPLNAVIIYDNSLRYPIWSKIEVWARRLAEIDQTFDINMKHQKIPWVITGPQERVFDMTQILRQAEMGEPAIIGYKAMDTIQTSLLAAPVPLISADLQTAKQEVWNEIYTALGISNISKKNERMIEDEVNANNDPVDLRLLDGLKCRRKATKILNDVFGHDIHVYMAHDFESDNYNYKNNLERTEEVQNGQTE